MKKLMVFAAVAAMAIGAQAAVYTFKLTVENLPQTFASLTDTGAMYLKSSDGSTVYAYSTIYGYNHGSTSGSVLTYLPTSEKHDATSVELDGKSFANVAHTLLDGTKLQQQDKSGNMKDVVFELSFEAADGFFTQHFTEVGEAGGQKTYNSDLVAVLTDSANPYDSGYYQEFQVGAIGNSNPSISANGAYPTPEPTSAMLLLLGMAGLCLKRKVA